MKIAVAVCFLTAVFASPFNSELDAEWESFKAKHGKTYSIQEEGARRLIWEQNVNKIIKHNLEYDLKKYSYYLGLNEYADMSHKEFVSKMNGLKKSNRTWNSQYTFLPFFNAELPKTVDWRTKGYVTKVKNQGHCGSCWAFSATGSVEGQHKRKTGTLVSLSEQNLVDCSKLEGNEGCDGGLTTQAFEYILKNNGIDTEVSYPYEAVLDVCRFNRGTVGATISDYADIPFSDENALQNATAAIGPISVAIDASSDSFMLYSGGVFDNPNCSTSELDHAVLVVGYGTYNGQDYWLVKNSWGESWGLDGYIMMSRNKQNQCGIASDAHYPVV